MDDLDVAVVGFTPNALGAWDFVVVMVGVVGVAGGVAGLEGV
jgi:hypothetical protein